MTGARHDNDTHAGAALQQPYYHHEMIKQKYMADVILIGRSSMARPPRCLCILLAGYRASQFDEAMTAVDLPAGNRITIARLTSRNNLSATIPDSPK